MDVKRRQALNRLAGGLGKTPGKKGVVRTQKTSFEIPKNSVMIAKADELPVHNREG
jgi:hypothetical protein